MIINPVVKNDSDSLLGEQLITDIKDTAGNYALGMFLTKFPEDISYGDIVQAMSNYDVDDDDCNLKYIGGDDEDDEDEVDEEDLSSDNVIIDNIIVWEPFEHHSLDSISEKIQDVYETQVGILKAIALLALNLKDST